ncbi:MAG TPA: SMP-30/gluconolactonase/LRE family protein, partial [Acidimicrobiales bacterium]|nr:SMP-30/gluconolactonase/LRE family protein [Acidimicrobiales bacterium]
MVVGLLGGTLVSNAAQAAPAVGTVSNFAGGVGFGTATTVGQLPVGVGILGDSVLEVDGPTSASELPPLDHSFATVVRAIDVRTGVERVIAGNQRGNFSGDGGPATGAALGTSTAVVGDARGYVYVSDSFNHRIRRVTPAGIITTIAGTGAQGFTGDGGPATKAALNAPSGLAIAPDGAILFADTSNLRVRRIGPDGVISTVAGNGTLGRGGDGGLAVQAQLTRPGSLAVDGAGNLYIADDGIRVVSPAGTIRTYAPIAYPRGIAVAQDGRVLFTSDTAIKRVDALGATTVVAGNESTGGFSGDGGPATAAQLEDPRGLAVSAAGDIYVADSGNRRIRRIDTTGVITTVGGNGEAYFGGDGGPAAGAQLWDPGPIRWGPDGLYISDRGNDRVRHVDATGVIRTLRAADAFGMAVDPAGNVFLSEGARVVKRSPDGTVTTVA